MYRRNSARIAQVALATCFVLALVLSSVTSPRAQAQAAVGVQSPPAPASAQPPLVQTPLQVLNGTVALVGHYNPEQKLRLALAIQPPHMDEEEQFIRELTTKGSPGFHKFLTQDQWNARFAPSVADEQAVVDWAESQGLTVTHRYSNRLLVDVEGTSGTIEKAFGVTINNYQVGDEVDFSNDRDPAIPANLTGILHTVLGLNNVERVHRIGSSRATVKGADYVPGPVIGEPGNSQGDADPSKAPAGLAPTVNTNGTASSPSPENSFPLDDKNGTYAADPRNIQSTEAYDFTGLQALSHCCNVHNDSTGAPAVSSIALVGYGGFSTSDTSTFFNAYDMAWNLTWYCIGGSTCPSPDGEAPLDVEYAGAMSNSYGSLNDTAHIYEYEMVNNLYTTYADAFNDIVSDDHAKVVSTSYGWEENVGFSGSVATGTMHPIFNNMVGTGWTLIAASGDNGASDGCGNATAVDYPSSDPDFLAAGGTQLLLNHSGIFQSEIGWQGEFWTNNGGACGNNHGGSTGGVSVLFAAPSWQSSLVSPYYEWIGSTEYKVTGNTNRLVPDISLTANPDVMGEWYYSGGSWQDEGGTSIVAPELAGFFAQENTYLNYIGNICGSAGTSACTPVGLASPFIYEDAIDGAPHDPFYDMTSGCNDNDVTTADGLVYFCAAPGFDLVTGWGSANMLQLAWGINWELIPAYGQPSIAFTRGPATNTWYNTDQEVSWTVSDAGSSGLPAPGVSGFTQGWDSIPADPYSEPHGGQNNSFYHGPQYAFVKNGCLSFNGLNGCTGGSGQGCHTVYVEGWDNQGRYATNSYGPICYDTTPPVTTASLSGKISSGTIYSTNVQVTLIATDTGGSGVHYTYFQRNGGPVTTYTGTFNVANLGSHTITYWSVDNVGNVESAQTVSFSVSSPTNAKLVASPKPSVYGQPVTMTATIGATLSGTPTGSVIFWNGATNLGTATLSANTATLVTTALPVGALTLQASYEGAADYLPSNSAPFDETVNKGTPVITWPTPAPITVGTAVGPTQQDATANVPGTFVYAQPAGWKPTVGTHTMTVTFTPTDTTDYKVVTATVTLTVNPAS